MKQLFFSLILGLLPLAAIAQKHTNEETLKVDLNGVDKIGLYNHLGDIKVIGTSTSEAKINYKRTLKSASEDRLEKAVDEINLIAQKEGDRLLIFVEAPDLKFQISPEGKGHYRSDGWKNRKDRYQVRYEFEIVLEMPASMDLDVSNHHSALEVEGVTGDLRAKNHHKDLLIAGAGELVEAHSHHGDVTVEHEINPTSDSYYHTHHGDIKVSYRDGLSADASLNTHHGSFFSELDWKLSPLKVTTEKGDRGTRYKIGKNTTVKFGNGGPNLDFDTHHGDIFIHQI